MKNIYEQQVYYSDTDAYGVVWHGSYLRWLEIGRVKLCDSVGLDIMQLQKLNVIFPVVEINLRYKSPAKLNDILIIQTSISSITKTSVIFEQKIFENKTNKLVLSATVKVVSVNNNGELYRKIPNDIRDVFTNSMEKNLCSV